MSNSISSISNQKSSLCPTNGRQTVGDGAPFLDNVLAVCSVQGEDNIYYYSTTFSGGPGVKSLSPASAIPIPASKSPKTPSGLPTPPLTPENSLVPGYNSFGSISAKQSSALLDILTTLFPHSGLTALPYAKSVKITSPALDAVWDGVILDMPGDIRTLYVHGKGAEHMELREIIVALLDLADEQLGCSAFVIALEKSSSALGALLHSLMYVGGTVVTKPPFKVDPAYVLVGIEI
ncbi:hypothetical protein M422DRAFT_161074 [Sphaerobolus stellatus SS14]|nr:hypothetical protein M422DRAFT_161074 [Sphaerobolus stellatus SS14]